jgi:hypothetical protein
VVSTRSTLTPSRINARLDTHHDPSPLAGDVRRPYPHLYAHHHAWDTNASANGRTHTVEGTGNWETSTRSLRANTFRVDTTTQGPPSLLLYNGDAPLSASRPSSLPLGVLHNSPRDPRTSRIPEPTPTSSAGGVTPPRNPSRGVHSDETTMRRIWIGRQEDGEVAQNLAGLRAHQVNT